MEDYIEYKLETPISVNQDDSGVAVEVDTLRLTPITLKGLKGTSKKKLRKLKHIYANAFANSLVGLTKLAELETKDKTVESDKKEEVEDEGAILEARKSEIKMVFNMSKDTDIDGFIEEYVDYLTNAGIKVEGRSSPLQRHLIEFIEEDDLWDMIITYTAHFFYTSWMKDFFTKEK